MQFCLRTERSMRDADLVIAREESIRRSSYPLQAMHVRWMSMLRMTRSVGSVALLLAAVAMSLCQR